MTLQRNVTDTLYVFLFFPPNQHSERDFRWLAKNVFLRKHKLFCYTHQHIKKSTEKGRTVVLMSLTKSIKCIYCKLTPVHTFKMLLFSALQMNHTQIWQQKALQSHLEVWDSLEILLALKLQLHNLPQCEISMKKRTEKQYLRVFLSLPGCSCGRELETQRWRIITDHSLSLSLSLPAGKS